MRSILAKALGAASIAMLCTVGTVNAAEVTLRAVSLFQPGAVLARPFEDFMEKVNTEGKGTVQIEFIGGPSAIPPFEMGNSVSSGVIDMAYVPAAFYTNLLPEASALKLAERTSVQLRENGGWELMNKLHNEK